MSASLKIISSRETLVGFRHFWGKYVRRFDPEQHCARCLLGKKCLPVKPGMATNARFPLAPPLPFDFLYLCGVADTDRWENNFHLALRPLAGHTASALTYRGDVVGLDDFDAVSWPALPAGWRGLGLDFTTCRNYQFGIAAYELATLSPARAVR